MYVINTANELKLQYWYVSIRNILGYKAELIIPKGTLLKVAYIFSSFNDISFRYPNGELVKQDIKMTNLDKAFRIPYTNEFKLARRE